MAILDKLNKGAAVVAANSKAMLEKSKINAAIGNLENERKQLAQLAGEKLYNAYKSDGEISVDESVANLFTEIDRRLELIEQQKDQLKRVEDELSLITGGTKSASQSGNVACSCGHVSPEGVKFCTKCGNQLSAG
ncbi:MAG: hypothetical protein FWC96_09350 [Oscillospiraceae bacterium]|nr:hypothetical protein [Oscillospiraceae bacterium]